MRKVGVKALKNGLSGYLRAVAAGETLLVTDRARVIAELGPPREEHGGAEPERQWAEMIRQGLVTPAKTPADASLPPPSLGVMTLDELMAEIEADREDR